MPPGSRRHGRGGGFKEEEEAAEAQAADVVEVVEMVEEGEIKEEPQLELKIDHKEVRFSYQSALIYDRPTPLYHWGSPWQLRNRIPEAEDPDSNPETSEDPELRGCKDSGEALGSDYPESQSKDNIVAAKPYNLLLQSLVTSN